MVRSLWIWLSLEKKPSPCPWEGLLTLLCPLRAQKGHLAVVGGGVYCSGPHRGAWTGTHSPVQGD